MTDDNHGDSFDWLNPKSIPSEANTPPTYRVGDGAVDVDESATTSDLAGDHDAGDDSTRETNE